MTTLTKEEWRELTPQQKDALKKERAEFKDAVEVARTIDALNFIASYGIALKKQGTCYKARCPFHSEDTPSFAVYPATNTWHCYGACQDGGDLIKFVMLANNVSFKDAVNIITGRTPTDITIKRKVHVPVEEEKPLPPMEEALRFHERFAEALPYFRDRRGIAEHVAREALVGVETCAYYMKDLEGNIVGKVYYPRYTIPHIINGVLYNIKKRCDGAALRDAVVHKFLDIGFAKSLPYEERMETEYRMPTTGDYEGVWVKALEKEVGRFIGTGGGKVVPYGLDDLLMVENGRWCARRKIPHLIVSAENKETDIMALKSHGYHAVGYTPKMNVELLASCVQGAIVVLGDNDGNEEQLARAKGVAIHIGGMSGRSIALAIPDGDAKDGNDLCLQNRHARFFERYGVGQAF